jgi:ATP-dependent Lhr-like helicase
MVHRASSEVDPTPTERIMASVGQLMARHGVLTRDAVAFEGMAGGFGAVYPVLSALEQQGRIRRGYFVVGLGGSQFADPGALERLRALGAGAESESDMSVVVLAAVDPANPYGGVLPWPGSEKARLARVPGAHVVLVEGNLAAYLTREEREIHVFLPEEEPSRSAMGRAMARALASWMRRTGRVGLAWSPDENPPASRGPLSTFLVEAGFQPWGPGFRLPPEKE